MEEIKNLIELIKTNKCDTPQCITEKTKLNEALEKYNLMLVEHNKKYEEIDPILDNWKHIIETRVYVDKDCNLRYSCENLTVRKRF